MALTFLDGSYQDGLEERISNGGGNNNGLSARVTDCESRLDNLESSEGSRTSDLPTNLNISTTLLGTLIGCVNNTNAKVNQHDDVLAAKGWLS